MFVGAGPIQVILKGVAAAALAAALSGAAGAQGILKKAPMQGVLWAGEIVFVDDGACPRGQIKMVIGAGRPRNEIILDTTPKDTSKCIVRPPPS
ncbi:MAG: DUF6719 family protein [Beijerinckiaceae bacterium]